MRIDIKGLIVSNDDKPVYDWFGIESTAPLDVVDKLAESNGQPIDIYLNSDGGDVFAGTEIYAALKEYKGDVLIHVIGRAISAATIIMCARESIISSTAVVMIHNASTSARGDHEELAHSAEVLKTIDKAIANAYTEKSGMEQSEVLALMAKESWFTAQEVVELGLVDRLDNEQPLQFAASYTPLLSPDVIAKVKNEVINPLNEAGFLMRKKAQAQIEILKMEEEK